jgi:ectoine hydroxylase-related dioxygenase (phytanoyl-CoA dioxygenase family)
MATNFRPAGGDAEVDAFEQVGAAVLRAVIPLDWIARMRAAIDRVMADPASLSDTRLGFYNGFFAWRQNETIRDFLMDSPLPEIAARFLCAREVSFFYDQLMVKEPETGLATPWHLDSSYFPTAKGKTLSIWVPFDRATPESGAVTYISRSHQWTATHGRKQAEAMIAMLAEPGLPITGQDLLAWSLDPGDVLIHHVDTIHGAPRNVSDHRRRALATRWMDQDVVYAPSDEDFFHLARKGDLQLPEPDLRAGERMVSDLFPKVWPRQG